MPVIVALTAGTGFAFAQNGPDEPNAPGKKIQQTVYRQVFGPNVTLQPGQEGGVTVECPAGQVPTGGGGGTGTTGNLNFDFSYASGRSWIIRGKNFGNAAEDLRAFAVCTPGVAA
ncbi:hypothetical protein [Streptomyces pinistramenti]|uniref:hypothetical protein n=1 Tax=Streptomyces pinistramenti TaxID=2884812 RepID=UPI001D08345D|nr:hypothetical protein [Streptomyces pinistramenti]MCB5907120.1 hypothetical protein [Streptomyces pinistramenti]